jgi:hypothetical protein
VPDPQRDSIRLRAAPRRRDVFVQPGIAGTFNLDHIKRHYYGSHKILNPYGAQLPACLAGATLSR